MSWVEGAGTLGGDPVCDGFKDVARAPEQLYVGLSRAGCLLVVVGDPDLIAEACGRDLELALGRAPQWS